MAYKTFEADSQNEESISLQSKRREIVFDGKRQTLRLGRATIPYKDIDEIAFLLTPRSEEALLQVALYIEHRASGQQEREKFLLQLPENNSAECLRLLEKIAATGAEAPIDQYAFRSSQRKELHWPFYRKEIGQHTLMLALSRQAKEKAVAVHEISPNEEKEVLGEHTLLQIPQTPNLLFKIIEALPRELVVIGTFLLFVLFMIFPMIVVGAISCVFLFHSWFYERQASPAAANSRLVLYLVSTLPCFLITAEGSATFWLSSVWLFNALFLSAWLWVRREKRVLAPLWLPWQLGTVLTIFGWVMLAYSIAVQAIPTVRRQLQQDQPLWTILQDKEIGEALFRSSDLLRSAARWCDGHSKFDTRECAFVYVGLRQNMFSDERIIYGWSGDTGVRLFIGALTYEISTPTPEDDLRENLPWLADRLPKQGEGFRLGMIHPQDATNQIHKLLVGPALAPAQEQALRDLLQKLERAQ